MAEQDVAAIRTLLERCSEAERDALFAELRGTRFIHAYEQVVGAPAEMILEAIHRAPELTRRMLRGVIADAAFAQFVVPRLRSLGWEDATPEGNFSYDYLLRDTAGPVSVQVKLQRSERGVPVERAGTSFGFEGAVYMTETQKTRGGTDGADKKTRPYRYGEFDVLAVSMQPSTGQWDRYMYTVGRWLIQGKEATEIAVMQPVTMDRSEYWTPDFAEVADWYRRTDTDKRMTTVRLARAKKKL